MVHLVLQKDRLMNINYSNLQDSQSPLRLVEKQLAWCPDVSC